MATIRSSGNRTTEWRLRALLMRHGLRGWSVGGARAIGSPDFLFGQWRIAVFVDGCFWHGCPRCGHIPKTNTAYWAAKIARNRRRDRKLRRHARKEGYTVLAFSECRLKQQPTYCLQRVVRTIATKRQDAEVGIERRAVVSGVPCAVARVRPAGGIARSMN